MKKHIALTLAIALGFSFLPSAAYAERGNSSEKEERKEIRQEIKQTREEFKQNIKEEKKEFRTEMKSLHEELKEKAKELFRGKTAKLTNAAVTAVSGSTMTASEGGKTYSINTSSGTKFRRHFWGTSSLNEISVGDKINVWGKWTDEAKTTIDAKMIRNLSVLKRHGVFFGEVLSTGSGSFVIKSLNRGNQTVSFDTNTKFINRRGESITSSDVKTGDRIRVRGLWDKEAGTITQVREVKDFSLPARQPAPTTSVTPSVSVTPTVSVSPTPTATNTPTPTVTPTP